MTFSLKNLVDRHLEFSVSLSIRNLHLPVIYDPGDIFLVNPGTPDVINDPGDIFPFIEMIPMHPLHWTHPTLIITMSIGVSPFHNNNTWVHNNSL